LSPTAREPASRADDPSSPNLNSSHAESDGKFGGVRSAGTSFPEYLAEKKAGITQRELAARLKREDGRPVDPPYLNAVEHDHRYPPEDSLIEQIAKIVEFSPDMLYFHANRQPPDVKTETDEARLEAAYRAFPQGAGGKIIR